MAKGFSKNVENVMFSGDKKPQEEFIVPKGYRLIKETKSERLQLLVRPNTKDTLRAMAKAKGVTLNDFSNQILEAFIENESNDN